LEAKFNNKSFLRADIIRLAPSSAKCSAQAFPIPDDAPVIKIILFFSEFIFTPHSKMEKKILNKKNLITHFQYYCRVNLSSQKFIINYFFGFAKNYSNERGE
jgi:hypothetical protein